MRNLSVMEQKQVVGGKYRFKVFYRYVDSWYWDDNGGRGYDTWSDAYDQVLTINNERTDLHALSPVYYN